MATNRNRWVHRDEDLKLFAAYAAAKAAGRSWS
jgi:hypothetical protein